MPALFIVQYIS